MFMKYGSKKYAVGNAKIWWNLSEDKICRVLQIFVVSSFENDRICQIIDCCAGYHSFRCPKSDSLSEAIWIYGFFQRVLANLSEES
jgi:hypothetical protein